MSKQYARADFPDSAVDIVGGKASAFPNIGEQQSQSRAGYTLLPEKFYHMKPCRNALGLVGGNEVSVLNGSMVDLESDLRGITRPNTKCPSKQLRPECVKDGECSYGHSKIIYYAKDNNEMRTINTVPVNLPTCQMNSYQAMPKPAAFQMKVNNTWKF